MAGIRKLRAGSSEEHTRKLWNFYGVLGGVGSDFLRYILKTALPYDKCKPLLHKEAQEKLNGSIVICARAKRQDACTGDSGGPMKTRGQGEKLILVGIISFGYGCAREKDVSGYTRVAAFVPWIEAMMRLFKNASPPMR
ncbi:serine protease 29-like [Amblyomma americanum]